MISSLQKHKENHEKIPFSIRKSELKVFSPLNGLRGSSGLIFLEFNEESLQTITQTTLSIGVSPLSIKN